jgi:hypothetical protein
VHPDATAATSSITKRKLPVFGVVDLDALFSVSGSESRSFRVVGIPVARNKAGDPDGIWLATTLFRALKSVGRLDELSSDSPAVIEAFIAATLIGLVLTQSICGAMRRHRPRCEPSSLRVFALVLANLPRLAAAYGTRGFREELRRFETALWREGVNPNPGRPYARERHLATVEK